ncbi:MAG TPA: hypothetical protein PK530_15170 [Anaerolineales bacterium]|nr:hypothetical protein [Anaerolineales bacterium]
MNPTAQKALAAYGGKDLWTNVKTIEAEVSVHGWAFTLKQRPFFKHAKLTMELARPVSRLTPIGKDPNITGVLDGHDVYLEDSTGKIIAERRKARRFFPGGRRLFKWDDLDMAYFANYAFWNYFTLPALLLRGDIAWKELTPGRLEATFPETIPTHNLIQQFRFDPETGLLIQHDYTADIISKLATAANVVQEHRHGEEVLYTSKRLVTPRAPSGKPLPGPTLIAITVHDFRLK